MTGTGIGEAAPMHGVPLTGIGIGGEWSNTESAEYPPLLETGTLESAGIGERRSKESAAIGEHNSRESGPLPTENVKIGEHNSRESGQLLSENVKIGECSSKESAVQLLLLEEEGNPDKALVQFVAPALEQDLKIRVEEDRNVKEDVSV